ncbi:hypothetical protein [Nocardia abscessus]|uniref:hypothetical protein n=1 Tax=Nocardia abscessus TaxID=120957 RepID=UPI0012F9D13F|nr:hypothetical protein [Nocardia abscessus]MCC3333551.1 hypothetical protein [Nocardia abscessus]
MSTKPLRIIRVPQAPAGPSAADPAPSNPHPGPSSCPRCGAYVADADLHAAHHDRADEWVKRVNAVLNDTMRLLLTREGIPTAEETTPTDGESQIGDTK